MGLFDFIKKKPDKASQPQTQYVPQFKDETEKRWYEARADKQYQEDLHRYYALCEKINERYTVQNTVGSFSDESANVLIAECVEAFELNMKLKEKMEYYEGTEFKSSPVLKTLAMVYEKRGEFERAATICVMAIESGFPADGTAGGMRGRLARMIKKGGLELTEPLRKILEI